MQTFDSSKQKLLNSDRNLLTAGGGGTNTVFARPTMPGRSKSNLSKRPVGSSNG